MDHTNDKDKLANILNSLEDGSVEGGEEAPTPKGEVPAESVEGLRKSLSNKTEEAQQLQDKYVRLAAEFENYKKLTLRDQRDHVRFANERLLKELLPVIDNLERAIKSGKENPSGDALVQGVELTLKQALEGLAKFGLTPMESVGQPFNPEHHQAVTQVTSATQPEKTVVDEFQRGYFLHDRVLRPAMVSVAGPPSSPAGRAEDGTTAEEEPPEAAR